MKFSVFQISRRGGRRKNEDRMGYCYTRSAAIFILADGMGGHPEGEVAAQLALQTIATLFQKEALPELANVEAFLAEALMTAQRQILHYGTDHGMLDCPRTTVVVAVVQDGTVTWTHCGDSRFYLSRRGALLARTRDHSLIEQNQSRPVQERSFTKLNRNVLFTCLGSPVKPFFKIEGPVSLQQGDRLLLCSDGLWSSVSDRDILNDLDSKPVHAAVPDLVEQALRQAGATSDNVTCLALEWETPDGFDSTRGGVSTEAIGKGDFASTVHADWPDSEAEIFDDAAIERSIEEINAAIRRSMAKKSK
ncbi:MAG: serine/threonine-protein phosphatase [Comamonadaceae bacterium]|nr:serine/threonine-protein phosphatase [Comamonadaceae bacterium]